MWRFPAKVSLIYSQVDPKSEGSTSYQLNETNELSTYLQVGDAFDLSFLWYQMQQDFQKVPHMKAELLWLFK